MLWASIHILLSVFNNNSTFMNIPVHYLNMYNIVAKIDMALMLRNTYCVYNYLSHCLLKCGFSLRPVYKINGVKNNSPKTLS